MKEHGEEINNAKAVCPCLLLRLQFALGKSWQLISTNQSTDLHMADWRMYLEVKFLSG
jgi:hypothetical protein